MSDLQEKIAQATENLDLATVAYHSAAAKASAAESYRIEAMNNLNKRQKEFDTVVERIRGEAPNRTDWQRERDRSVSGGVSA